MRYVMNNQGINSDDQYFIAFTDKLLEIKSMLKADNGFKNTLEGRNELDNMSNLIEKIDKIFQPVERSQTQGGLYGIKWTEETNFTKRATNLDHVANRLRIMTELSQLHKQNQFKNLTRLPLGAQEITVGNGARILATALKEIKLSGEVMQDPKKNGIAILEKYCTKLEAKCKEVMEYNARQMRP
jgi:hypothetical protein